MTPSITKWTKFEGPIPDGDKFEVSIKEVHEDDLGVCREREVSRQRFNDEASARNWMTEQALNQRILGAMVPFPAPAPNEDNNQAERDRMAAAAVMFGDEWTARSIPTIGMEESEESRLIRDTASFVSKGRQLSKDQVDMLKWNLTKARDKADLVKAASRNYLFRRLGSISSNLENVQHRLFSEIGVHNLEPADLIKLYTILQSEFRDTSDHLEKIASPVQTADDFEKGHSESLSEAAVPSTLPNAASRARITKVLNRISSLVQRGEDVQEAQMVE